MILTPPSHRKHRAKTTVPDLTMQSSKSSEDGMCSDEGTKVYRRKKFACVECRQQKSRCDASEKAPGPCTKCKQKGVTCVLKKDFRRTYKRARNEAIEKRFKELTASLSNLSSEEILQKIKEEQEALLDNRNFTRKKVKKLKLEAEHPSLDSRTASNTTPVSYTFPTVQKMTEDQLKCTPKSLDDICMSSEEIADIFQEFATHYHQFLPVVNLNNGAEKIYALSPCLFWVILLIGLRRCTKYHKDDIMNRLSMLVKNILAEITISPIIRYTPDPLDEPILNVASVYSVQAFLLYTFWPPLTSSLSADTSWNTIGTAMFQAVRVGLNCADFSKEYADANAELIIEQRRTWICCNIVSQIIASSFGFPSYVSFDHSVMSSIKNFTSQDGDHPFKSSIPDELIQMTQIAHFESQIINTMNSNPSNKLGMVSPEERQPLLRVLNQQLSQLELNLQTHNIDDTRKFLLLVSKVHLLTYYFTEENKSELRIEKPRNSMDLMEKNFETKTGLVKVYNATVNLLNHAQRMSESDPTIIKYFPGCFVLNIWQSACIISKLVHSSLSTVIDVGRGKDAYQFAIRLTYQASVLKHDMAYRSSGIMRSIWSLFGNMYDVWKHTNKDMGEFNLYITVKSRMAVSVFFDCLYILKEKCGMAKLEREGGKYLLREAKNEEEDDDSEGEYDNLDVQDQKRGKRNAFTHIKDPEERARRIMETIPLDPNPINAGGNLRYGSSTHSNSAKSNTPLQGSPLSIETISNARILHSLDSHDSIFKHTKRRPVNDTEQQPKNQLFENRVSQLPHPATTEDTINTPADEELLSLDDPAVNPIMGSAAATAFPSFSNSDSPGSNRMVSWDNWQSDVVWKDVDILMNEFAFNPTV
ncbi:leucine-responsive transcriptional regulator LEU3 KNAG_0D05240 [Huiozyma naganishii CBS 8797]|uniref:Zn(2)-C6 fungal-type domain-containing protein n=1 Tax=Huiozyma naganishii (strain ATCC MYA-139 / BCRC 22969 / CBS 8797 / KCTC 17520 / NBRC 10181 / NCYC 3082 / Yp74L-3) TaxID=1071383 RepID=J7RYL4_HUIN7|nr:hypothetical protein KNAG_0D05240 [Kazachstania naganishii CBS 8797]CCK70262.1 hypothetical protein KNAG_0D05240 [Kazachstania naganishii CBS 8797]